MCSFCLVRAQGPESKKNEPRSGAGTSEKLYANYVSIGFYDYGQAIHVSHIPPSSHAPFCPITLQALSKLCPSRVFEVPSCMFPIFRHPVMPHSAQALSKLCPSPPFLSKLATKQCREFKFLLLSGVCESHNSGIQSLVATFGGLRVPQIRPLVMSHLVQSLSDRCPNCDRAPPHF